MHKRKPHHLLFVVLVVFVLFVLGIHFGRNITLPLSSDVEPTPIASDDVIIEKPVFKEVYKGVLACADCSGLQTEVSFYRDQEYQSFGTYEMQEIYTGKSVEPFVTRGKWTLLNENNKHIYELTPSDSGSVAYYLQVGSNQITMLDSDKKEINSPFNNTLTKQKNTQLANPAAVNCADQGGKSEIREDEAGNEYGVCIMDDYTCDEWKLFRENKCIESTKL